MAKHPPTEQTQTDPNPTDDTSTPKPFQIVIAGLEFLVQPRYAAGHVLLENEATALNQTYAENLRNNFASKVKAAASAQLKSVIEVNGWTEDEVKALTKEQVEELSTPQGEALAELNTLFTTYSADYVFSGKRAPAVPVDPVGKEAYKMAKQVLTEHFRKLNVDMKKVDNLDDLIGGLITKNPSIREEAQRRVDTAKSLATLSMPGLPEAPQAQAAE